MTKTYVNDDNIFKYNVNDSVNDNDYDNVSHNKINNINNNKIIAFVFQIGGFLGLLLGASVLTICEVLDYLFIRVYDIFHKRRKS